MSNEKVEVYRLVLWGEQYYVQATSLMQALVYLKQRGIADVEKARLAGVLPLKHLGPPRKEQE
jgi:hypothetical protein